MKKIVALLLFMISVHLYGDDIVVFDNEYNVVPLHKSVKRVIVGNRDMINVSLLKGAQEKYLKIFGKKTGVSSILLVYRDGTMKNYHVYVNKNLGYVQKMVNFIEPSLKLNRVGDGSTVMTGTFKNPHDKKRVFALLHNAGIDFNTTMDLTQTQKVNKMIRTKLYLVQIDNKKAKDLGGVTGLGFLDKHTNVALNPAAANGATFSGWLLDNFGQFSSQTGKSVKGTLNFLEEKGVGKILDDTVLITTEDQNASFRVGGEVYIPTGLTQNVGYAPTIQVEEKEYGLTLTLTTQFMEKDGFMHIDVAIQDSEFDTNKEHDVQLGRDIFVPSFVSKNITTNVVVKSGQVIALGGRLHTEETEKEEKVPFLGDIPLLGELFKHTVKSKKGDDLLFFLVPEIVDANDAVDDGHFYRDFSHENEKLHEKIFDMNGTQETQKESLAIKNDVAEVEDTKEQTIIISEDEPQGQNENIEVEAEPKEEVIKNVEVKRAQQEEQKQPLYTVDIENIYVRNKPSLSDSKRVSVWKGGHKFHASDEQDVDGVVWLKIDEDCQNECRKLEQPLWISKKYTKEL